MPTTIVDVSTFTDPITAPADGDALNAASINTTAIQKLSNRTRYLADRVGTATGAAEWVYPTARARNILVNLAAARAITDAAGATPQWAHSSDPGTAVIWRSVTNTGILVLPLNDYLRDGMVITDVRVALKPGVARAGAARINLGLQYELPDWTTVGNNPVTPQVVGGAYAFDDTTANKQYVTLASILGAGHTVVRNSATPRGYFLAVYAGNDAATNIDLIYGVRLDFTDPGPRNQ